MSSLFFFFFVTNLQELYGLGPDSVVVLGGEYSRNGSDFSTEDDNRGKRSTLLTSKERSSRLPGSRGSHMPANPKDLLLGVIPYVKGRTTSVCVNIVFVSKRF